MLSVAGKVKNNASGQRRRRHRTLTSAFKCSQRVGKIKGMKNGEGDPNTCWKNHKEIYKKENLISSRLAGGEKEGENATGSFMRCRNQI